MSRSSQRRLANAAIKNAADTAHPSATGLPVEPARGIADESGQIAVASSVFNIPPAPLCQSSNLLVPYVVSDSPASSSSSPEISNLKSAPDSKTGPARSTPLPVDASSPSESPSRRNLPPGARIISPVKELESDFFKTHLKPHCIPRPEIIELPPITTDPLNPAGPIDSQFAAYQSKLKPIFANLSPDDPSVERISHNYIIIMQIATVERLIHSLPGLSEKAQVETNDQIVRMLAIIERTNARRARELREKDAAARRLIREQQRKERQAQREAEAIERNQRNQQREERRRQRDQLLADIAEKKYQTVVHQLSLAEHQISHGKSRDFNVRVKPATQSQSPDANSLVTEKRNC